MFGNDGDLPGMRVQVEQARVAGAMKR